MEEIRIYDPLVDKSARSLKGFTHIRAYHACRVQSIERYKAEGIRTLGYDELLMMTKERLSSLNIEEQKIEKAFSEIWKKYEACMNRHVYLGVWKEELLQQSGHYLVYGSETITAVAATLGGEYFQSILKRIGKPTLIVCNVPIVDIDDYWLNSISRSMPINSDASVYVDEVRPDNIIGFEYPKKIFDPLLWRDYKYDENDRIDLQRKLSVISC